MPILFQAYGGVYPVKKLLRAMPISPIMLEPISKKEVGMVEGDNPSMTPLTLRFVQAGVNSLVTSLVSLLFISSVLRETFDSELRFPLKPGISTAKTVSEEVDISFECLTFSRAIGLTTNAKAKFKFSKALCSTMTKTANFNFHCIMKFPQSNLLSVRG